MNQIPCINPVCTHLFNVAELSGTSLKCPKCGQEIQVRASAAPPGAAPKKPAAPLAKPVPAKPVPAKPSAKPIPGAAVNVPVAKSAAKAPAAPHAAPVKAAPPVKAALPAKPAAPLAKPIVPAPLIPAAGMLPPPPPAAKRPPRDDDLGDLDSGGYRPTPRISAPSSKVWLKLLAVVFILLGGALAVFLAIRRFSGSEERPPLYEGEVATEVVTIQGISKGKPEPAFKVVLPKDKGWSRDETVKKKMKALTAWWDDDKQVYLAVAAKDYGIRKPREAELVQVGMDALTGYFDEDTLEMEQTPQPSEPKGWDNARKLKFKGQAGAVAHFGEMHYFSRHGIGFWVYLYGPPGKDSDYEKAQSTLKWLEDVRLGMTVVDERKGWTEREPPLEPFDSVSGLLSLNVPERLYSKSIAAKELEDEPDLSLLGRFQEKSEAKERDNRKNAHIEVYLLEREASLEDAMKKAKEHVLGRLAAGSEGYKLIAAPDVDGASDLGKETEIGGRAGRVGDFCLLLGDKRERLVVIGVVDVGDKLCVIACNVVWEHRPIWHSDFHDVMAKARLKK
jgi:hypothetical protein